MIGLMNNGPASAAWANASADHPNHTSSSASTSRSTLLSTRVQPASSGLPGQGHGLVKLDLGSPSDPQLVSPPGRSRAEELRSFLA
jgi:hypothetical protein